MNRFPREPAGMGSMTIRELLAELARLEERLADRGVAADSPAHPETAQLHRRMREIRAELRRRPTDRTTHDGVSFTDANEADRVEQSIPVEAGPDEEYPHQQEIDQHS